MNWFWMRRKDIDAEIRAAKAQRAVQEGPKKDIEQSPYFVRWWVGRPGDPASEDEAMERNVRAAHLVEQAAQEAEGAADTLTVAADDLINRVGSAWEGKSLGDPPGMIGGVNMIAVAEAVWREKQRLASQMWTLKEKLIRVENKMAVLQEEVNAIEAVWRDVAPYFPTSFAVASVEDAV